ncbi:lipoprotein ABC transporter ATP-binding protein [Piscirickettsia salmonis]|uniref:Lipoprotein-releasing system ATP-binding protein LolD n=1 Tax=Piscirickettsia salmonis TaxID=1238 RepID=A0A9Q6PSM8_PISSA|nr:lipoprotein-releasing ABC transporter ATP-binding protein LolD [Piscirickettsia salmonis]ALA25183.1 lipoprotein ABC transporter ATP-binding protein [Piscirickettsia salmonis]APS45447.1 lipoprotein ABC transporter ATP-binding protein [Piscirickettsia salmonis]APS48808.1 lipoprotein ABC transporter ATP-binding protein [Piscirickettsia salmonis]APS50044.1 lipoprotein ABC transporter ATP-binding protein [Piscirickettsia salmonis]APS53244.1 lipoprotein ABC transporter ATP-binding protein [Piscir
MNKNNEQNNQEINQEIVLSCTGLGRSFNDGNRTVDVLKEVSLEVKAAESVAVMGSSGSGKTTLLYLLGGLDQPNKGEVCVKGQPLQSLSRRQTEVWRNQHLGFIYQLHHLLPEFSALENVMMPLWIQKKPTKMAKAQALALLDQVGLSHRAGHRPGELSGGERQRVAIARALVTEPVCVLADEPTGNLDQETAAQVMEVMQALNRELHTSFIVVTHNIEIAATMDRTLVLDRGEVQYKKIRG